MDMLMILKVLQCVEFKIITNYPFLFSTHNVFPRGVKLKLSPVII